MFDLKRSYLIILLLGAFCAFDVSAKGKRISEKIEPEPDKNKTVRTDSLENLKERALIVNVDSVTEDKKTNTPSSMSSMSYNILFQVIYRYSFKEIFDSPAASEIVTN